MADLDTVLAQARACTHCTDLPLGPRPVLRAATTARLLIIGQAPGTRVHETGIPWNDRSGDRLRDWMGLDRETFYDERQIAILPMGLCYPGVNPKGGDNPPRPDCAPLWHGPVMALLPNIALTLLIGQYAQKYYLGPRRGKTMTETVRQWRDHAPDFLPLPHPSWRNTGWMKKNPWFEAEVVPALRHRMDALN
ncbi:uracil-DNA glycosylase family protein [Magnetospira sp. QH-2]|uniref:uracil-DNA glycosylase family protein n=1 Tax=Magnetospira sp. (strain QH-2) TaxID=1288970 RepID=UPI0003E810AF|nr:uracil-DNA glycosylase family protein [Magnetospira sp. QH-2]CCQ72078.1 Uracil-DNA glycosylase protein [Magnetospira sp. QH-2]